MEESTAPSFSSSFKYDVDEDSKEHKQSTTYFNGPRSQGSMYSYFGIPRSRKEHIAKVRFWPLSGANVTLTYLQTYSHREAWLSNCCHNERVRRYGRTYARDSHSLWSNIASPLRILKVRRELPEHSAHCEMKYCYQRKPSMFRLTIVRPESSLKSF